jgi:DNA-binding transcriptional MerR regulator
MNEKTLEKITGLSRRQIIMLQKTVIQRKNKIVVGISYDYSEDEVEQFILAKMLKDCGYNYSEIKKEMDNYKINRIEVLDKAISKTEIKIDELKETLKRVYELKKKVED